MYNVIIEKPVAKFLEKHKWEKLITQFEYALTILSQDPYENNLDIRIVQWLPDSYALRIGKYRFLYEVIEDTISISFFKAESRGSVYKKL